MVQTLPPGPPVLLHTVAAAQQCSDHAVLPEKDRDSTIRCTGQLDKVSLSLSRLPRTSWICTSLYLHQRYRLDHPLSCRPKNRRAPEQTAPAVAPMPSPCTRDTTDARWRAAQGRFHEFGLHAQQGFSGRIGLPEGVHERVVGHLFFFSLFFCQGASC